MTEEAAGDVDDDKVDVPAPPAKKITIDEMIEYCLSYIGDLDRNVEFFKERPETCDHRPAERKAQAFRQMVNTLELVKRHGDVLVRIVRQEREQAEKQAAARRGRR